VVWRLFFRGGERSCERHARGQQAQGNEPDRAPRNLDACRSETL